MRRIIVGISGASGALYGIRLLEELRAAQGVQTHLVLSRAALRTIDLETGWTRARVEALADAVHDVDDLAAPIASGSFPAEAMVVAPCSMRTLSAISLSLADNLLTRAADVALKERRTLVLCVRETPLHAGHLRRMLEAAELGAVIAPPLVALYHKPATVDEVIDHGVGRLLDALNVPHSLYRRWEGPTP